MLLPFLLHCLPWGSRRGDTRQPRSRRPQRPLAARLCCEQVEARMVRSTLTVLNNLDLGAGSLRDTIARVKSGDTIVFDPGVNGQTITLTSGQLAIKKSLSIQGPGAGLLAISGNDSSRVFDI